MGRLKNESVRLHFHPIDRGGFKQARLACNYCQKSVNDGTQKLYSHLERCGPFKAANPPPPTNTMVQYAASLTNSQLEALHVQAATAIFTSGKAFSSYDHPEMKAFLRLLNPAYQPPSAWQLTNRYLPLVYNQYKAQLLEVFRRSSRLNIIFDGQVLMGRPMWWETAC